MPQTKEIPFASSESLIGSDFGLNVDFAYSERLGFEVLGLNAFSTVLTFSTSRVIIDSGAFSKSNQFTSNVSLPFTLSSYTGAIAYGFEDVSDITVFELNVTDGQANGSLFQFEKLENLSGLNYTGESTNQSVVIGDFKSLPLLLESVTLENLNFSNAIDIADLSSTVANFNLTDCVISDSITYTAGKTWSAEVGSVIITPLSSGDFLTTSEVDNILIDLASDVTLAVGDQIIDLSGDNANRSSASDAAVSYLEGLGFTVLVNEPSEGEIYLEAATTAGYSGGSIVCADETFDSLAV